MKNLNFIDWICKLTSMPRFTGSPLMQPQSGADHGYRITMIAMVIVDDYNYRHPKQPLSREEVLMKALLHDVEESVLGDVPSPVKYFTPELREQFRVAEERAMKEYVLQDAGPNKKEYYQLWKNAKKGLSGKVVKISDKLEGFIKINFEISQGNAGLISAYYDTVDWFDDNEDLIAPFPKAVELINHYRLQELDSQNPRLLTKKK